MTQHKFIFKYNKSNEFVVGRKGDLYILILSPNSYIVLEMREKI